MVRLPVFISALQIANITISRGMVIQRNLVTHSTPTFIFVSSLRDTPDPLTTVNDLPEHIYIPLATHPATLPQSDYALRSFPRSSTDSLCTYMPLPPCHQCGVEVFLSSLIFDSSYVFHTP